MSKPVADLVRQWRKEALDMQDNRMLDRTVVMLNLCADQLEAALKAQRGEWAKLVATPPQDWYQQGVKDCISDLTPERRSGPSELERLYLQHLETLPQAKDNGSLAQPTARQIVQTFTTYGAYDTPVVRAEVKKRGLHSEQERKEK